MALEIASRLGPYSVTAKIGEGDMGEVYRARDTKLDGIVFCRRRKWLWTMSILWACLSVISAAQEVEWATYRSDEAGFAMSYPARWRVLVARERSSPGAVRSDEVLADGESLKVTFQERDETVWGGEFQVRRVEPSGRGSVEAAYKQFDLSDLWDDSAADVVLAGRPAKTWVRWKHDALWREYLVVASDVIVHLRFDESNSNDPAFDSHQQIYAQMAASFRIL